MAKMRKLFVALLSGSLIGLAGCEVPQTTTPTPSPLPKPRPKPLKPIVTPQVEVSQQMSQHLARLQADLLVQGLLRVDGGGPDTPFSQRNLVDNFIRIALYDENTTASGQIVARESESHLRRWEKPIRMKVEFGSSVPLAQRNKDRAKISSYVKRLSRLTGVPIHLTHGQANFNILILNEDERRAAGPRLHNLVPGIGQSATNSVTNLDPSILCLVFASFNDATSSTYSKAVAVIRGEHSDLLRLSCIHEELAQGLGLANDSPAARPSIFNDDEEFGLLTHHDELLLQILYDRRLRAGMTKREAKPIVEQIVAELLGGST